jgi:heptosyltransferase-2
MAKKQKKLRVPDCKHFQGYKPCFPGSQCLDECVDPQPRGTSILIVNLEAMGNVLVTTSLLPAIKRKYPRSMISWITLPNAIRLLEGNPYLDRVYVWGPESWLTLQAMTFDVVMTIDKSVAAGAFAASLTARRKVGYGIDRNGTIVPLNREAEYNYRLGLDDHLKFRVNEKPNTQLLTEAMGLKFRRDEYVLRLSAEEERFCADYRRSVGLGDATDSSRPLVVGLNTGCSLLYPNKKMTIDQHVVLIGELAKRKAVRTVLLGGPEDTERNAEIVRQVGDKAISTPTTEGVRRGICYENICDVVISGDSFGMHVAIALRKYVVVWFGVSCPQEIDLYDRGVKFVPEGLGCSPCWKKSCPYDLECIQMIDLDRMAAEVDRVAADRSLLAAGEV